MNFVDLTGQRFGKLVVVKRSANSDCNETRWECVCDCGQHTIVQAQNLKNGHTKSCGCLRRIAHHTTHGKSGTRLYYIWNDMRNRCSNPIVRDFPNYGGRGIKMCDEWSAFDVFHSWAFENGYNELAKRGEFTLDRIDPNGDYCPENCRWVNIKTQQNNRANNVRLSHNGKTQTLAQWAEEYDISYGTLHRRIKLGWDIGKALATEVKIGQKTRPKTTDRKENDHD